MELLSDLTVRARVAFHLAVAEEAFATVAPGDPGRARAREALDAGWRWVEGAPVSADELYRRLENEQDTGLMVWGQAASADPEAAAAWCAIIDAWMYLVWRAYAAESCVYLPQTIEDVDETMIDDLLGHAGQTRSFDPTRATRRRDRLLERHRRGDVERLGQPLTRDEALAAG